VEGRDVPRRGSVRPNYVHTEAVNPDEVVRAEKEVSVVDVPYHPQAQFLFDVDGDGRIDHLYCCEAAVTEYLNATGMLNKVVDPFFVETSDTLVEYDNILNKLGSDAGWHAPILYLLTGVEPVVHGPRQVLVGWSCAYRTPVVRVPMVTKKPTVNHDLLVVGVDKDRELLLLHCTYNGPCLVTYENFDSATLFVTTTESVEAPGYSPSKTAEKLIDETDKPVLASVNAHALNPVARLGTVPFIIAVEEGFYEDWKKGLSDELPPDRDDRLCYLMAIEEKSGLPVYDQRKHDWLKWLEATPVTGGE